LRKNQVNYLVKIFKAFLYVLGAGALLLALVAALTQTRFFKDWLRDQIIHASRETLDGTLALGRIDGNLISRLAFSDIVITQAEDTILVAPRLQFTLQPFALLKKELHLLFVDLDGLRLRARQLPDSSLNLANLLRRDEKSVTASASTKWGVRLGSLSLNQARIEYTSLDTLRQRLPRRVDVRRARVAGVFVEGGLELNVEELQFAAFSPEVELLAARAKISAAGDRLSLDPVYLRTSASQFTGKIEVSSLSTGDFHAEAQLNTLSLSEVQEFFPALKVDGEIKGRLLAHRTSGAFRGEAEVKYGDAIAQATAIVNENDSSYSTEGMVRRLNLAAFGIDSTRASSVNARWTLAGRGFDWPKSTMDGVAQFDSSRVGGIPLRRGKIQARLDRGFLQTRVEYSSALGAATATANIRDLFGMQSFDFLIRLDKFDLSRFLSNLQEQGGRVITLDDPHEPGLLHTHVSMTCAGAGRSFDPATMTMAARLRSVKSEIGVITIDSLSAGVRVDDQKIFVDSLYWHSPLATVYAEGNVSFDWQSHLRFYGGLGNLELIRQLVEADSLRADGVFAGTVSGPLDSLSAKASFGIRHLHWNTTSAKHVHSQVRYSSQAGGALTAEAGGLLFGIVPLDTASAQAQFDLEKIDFEALFARGARNFGEIIGRYAFGDTARLDLSRCELFLADQVWRGSGAPMWIDIYDEAYVLHNVILQSANQRVFAEGRLDYLGDEDVRFGVENLKMTEVAAFFDSSADIEGVIDARLRLFGSASDPLLQGKCEVRNARLGEFRFPAAQGSIGYADERLFWDFALQQSGDRALISEGYLPMNLALDNRGEALLRNRPMRVQFGTDGLDLSLLQPLFPKAKKLRGLLAFSVEAENTPGKLQPTGYVRIEGGGFTIPKYGIEYNDLQLSAQIDTASITMDKLTMAAGGGSLAAEGRMDFAAQGASALEAAIRAQNFLVMRNRDVDLRINADVLVGGTLDAAGFAGDLTVARSRFFLPALQPTSVLQVDGQPSGKAAADCTQVADTRLEKLLNKSYGELRVIIPRNTWLRGPEINVEIEGELNLVVDGSNLLLFGPINVVRGNYELYGNKFTIEQGKLTFQGEKDMRPEISLDAVRNFRNAATKEKQVIRVSITGNLDAPTIAFQLDEQSLEERDALSYLLFGISFEDLTHDQQGELAGQGQLSNVARGLLTGLVAKQITSSLARNLNLDVIEFQGGNELSESSVLVGKYLTDDLFLSYSRDFSAGNAQKVSLEYEIARYLFLQAATSNEKDTGFDLIWKWEW
jgi:translocation and assembly module TamB